ncbi:hypothetical protein pb186bvf_017346 [Paramecium bursaria]
MFDELKSDRRKILLQENDTLTKINILLNLKSCWKQRDLFGRNINSDMENKDNEEILMICQSIIPIIHNRWSYLSEQKCSSRQFYQTIFLIKDVTLYQLKSKSASIQNEQGFENIYQQLIQLLNNLQFKIWYLISSLSILKRSFLLIILYVPSSQR